MAVVKIDGFTVDIETVILDERNAMPVCCVGPECPFTAAAKGEDYLRPGRLEGIKLATVFGRQFACHKTTGVAGGRKKHRQCRGALNWLEAWAAEHGVTVHRITAKGEGFAASPPSGRPPTPQPTPSRASGK
jgi:hypothetical protein